MPTRQVSYGVVLRRYEPTDPRLGRHVEHDERSWKYRLLPKTAKPKGKTTFWGSKIPVLDQGDTGSCTGNAEAQWLNTDYAGPVRAHLKRAAFTEADALRIYSLGTHLDTVPGSYPPDDSGSTGNGVARAGIKLGYLASYSWLFSFTSLQAALERTPLMLGTVWTNSMFTPRNGLVKVGKITDATIAGGHEYLGAGIDWAEQVIIARNQWGDQNLWPGCKPGGYFGVGFGKTHDYDLERLLEAQGDVTVPVGVS